MCVNVSVGEVTFSGEENFFRVRGNFFRMCFVFPSITMIFESFSTLLGGGCTPRMVVHGGEPKKK